MGWKVQINCALMNTTNTATVNMTNVNNNITLDNNPTEEVDSDHDVSMEMTTNYSKAVKFMNNNTSIIDNDNMNDVSMEMTNNYSQLKNIQQQECDDNEQSMELTKNVSAVVESFLNNTSAVNITNNTSITNKSINVSRTGELTKAVAANFNDILLGGNNGDKTEDLPRPNQLGELTARNGSLF